MSGESLLEYIDLPAIPDEWLLSLEEIKKLPSFSPIALETHNLYYLRKVTDERIINLLQPHLDFDISNSLFYQYIGKQLGSHIDYGRKTVINYIINTGGENVVTKWFSGTDVIFQDIIEEKRWHKITVDIPHSVDNIQTDRYMLTIHRVGQ